MEKTNEIKVEVKFVGIDTWNRPVFKDANGNYYGSTDKLFRDDAPESEVLARVTVADLTFFGRYFGCEPMGTRVENLTISKKGE